MRSFSGAVWQDPRFACKMVRVRNLRHRVGIDLFPEAWRTGKGQGVVARVGESLLLFWKFLES